MIEVIRVATKSTDFKKINHVYKAVFPKNERLPLSFLRMRAKAGKAEFCSIYDQQKWVGFFYTVFDRRIAYIFFLAIDPYYHSRGYGSATLAAIKKRYANKLVTLSTERIDPIAVNNSQRIRRQQFYINNGFEKTGFYTIEKDNEKFDLMSQQQSMVNPQLFQQLMNRFLTNRHRHYMPFKIISE
ncbi:GNAT family N-acetyltransferase [Limosilactobacillus sp. STM2_1]|uniref:GNAT family N-acetyltransferase n=1 Tax=Limosilactobacillus rudii TaxID=2759755 RepID=A0A7W3YLW6_9LACO|nr:GNAT family N-acetyltransferase [Limosilactobacillus rudii]MBB1080029.1 GNAT family N-acetyltransferase [Limosilactobacillus rudii]MBB1096483.1 GNAT family N-acetyltransferase [Limosilactobacillus rudii]MCD7133516.1 GNAT family N-acetyltransferase [Limosilactobacillus rudii]